MKCDLVKHDYSVDEYLNKLQTQVEDKLLEHDFIATTQSDYIKSRQHNLREDETMVIGDFAQNYTTTHQDQVQANHWNGKQVTIHLFATYLMEKRK